MSRMQIPTPSRMPQTKLAGIASGAEVNVDTDLSIANHDGDSLDIESSTGTDITLNSASQTEAGLQSATDKTKLDGIEASADANVPTNLAVMNRTGDQLDVSSSTGTDATIESATTTDAGLLSAQDKQKLRRFSDQPTIVGRRVVSVKC